MGDKCAVLNLSLKMVSQNKITSNFRNVLEMLVKMVEVIDDYVNESKV